MPTRFRPYNPDQSLLLPPSLADWLPEGHLAYFISDTVDQLTLEAFYEPFEGDGRRNRPYEPRMMLKVLLYGYATGVFSSRKIARKLHEDIAFRVLGAGNFPAHRTLAQFRQNHLEDFEEIFVQVVRIAGEVGLAKFGTVAVDGSKIKANASKRKAMSYGRMLKEEKRLRKEIRALTVRAGKVDAGEDAQFGPDFDGNDIPSELARREDRLARIREARKRLEQRQADKDGDDGRTPGDHEGGTGKRGRPYKRRFGEVEEKAQENFTDSESRIMKTSGGFEQCYNAQIMVDEAASLIVATSVTNCASDVDELTGLIEAVSATTGRLPKRLLADAGYRSESNLEHLTDQGIDGYIATGREGKNGNTVDATRNPLSARMKRKLGTKRGRARYKRRKSLAEAPFGWVKSVLGFKSFSLRGQSKVRGEWNLVCSALDLRRMSTMMAWR